MRDCSVAMSKTAEYVPPWLVALYAGIFSAVLYLVFSHNSACLWMSQDGNALFSAFKSQQAARQPFGQLGVDPLQGNFDAYPAVLREYFTPEAIALLFTGGVAGKVFGYTVYGIMLMLSTFVLARVLDFPRRVAFLAGTSCAAMALPTTFSEAGWVYPVYNLVPFATQSVCFATLIIACFWAIDVKRPLVTAGTAIAVVAMVILSVASNPALLALMVPVIAVYGGASIFLSRQRSAVVTRAGLAISCIGVPAALGMVQYAMALAIYTAYYYFGHEFQQNRASLEFASLFFQRGTAGKLLIIGGLVGALCCAALGPRRARLFAKLHVITTLLFLPASFLVVRFAENYHGPSPFYFEYMMWPIMFLFSSYAVFVVGCVIGRRMMQWNWPALPAVWAPSTHGVFLAVPLFLVCWNGWAIATALSNTCSQSGYFPIRPNAITDHLIDSIATKVGTPFRGLAATFVDVNGRASVDWPTMAADDARRSVVIGNDLRTSDLWLQGIPTLMQYSPMITPPYYLVLTEFLSRPSDKQVRNSLVLSQLNQAMLQLWGTRFLITDFVPGFGETKARLAEPGGSDFRLIELPDPNLGNYSPTQVEQITNFHDGLILMKKPGYNGRSTVVTEAALGGSLVGASDVKLVYRKTGFTLRATSAGRSILVLPIQYSRCWSVSGKGDPFTFRANLMQLGVGFTGTLDATLTFRFGPFLASSCRVQDISDIDRLRIRSARTW